MDVIDTFLATFIAYIDSGFGLLAGDVAYLSTTLIAIDITLAGLFWALSQNTDVIAGLLKKVLYVGFFAFIIGNFSLLAGIVFDSFAELGVTAGGGTMTADDLLRPGFIASVGLDAGQPLLEEISDMLGPISFFHNFIMIAVMFIAWAIIMVAFFVLAVQLFITILEFKLTTLAGFVLVPFALWNKTTFLAERVLGNVITSGIKLMVLAIVIGIVLALVLRPGAGIDLSGAEATTLDSAGSLTDRLMGIVPENPFAAFAEGNVLAVIFFAVLVGAGLILSAERGKPLVAVFDAGSETMLKVTAIVMEFAPFGVFALVAWVMGTVGPATFINVFLLAVAVYLGCFLHMLIVHGGIVKLFARLPVLPFFRGVREPQLVAYSTSSSSATLPASLSAAEHNLGISAPVASSVLPLGATINMDGTALYVALISIFAAQAFGLPLDFFDYVLIGFTTTLVSIGTASVPSASLFLMAAVLDVIGMSSAQTAIVVGFILPFDRILDMMRTVANVTGDLAVATVVSVWEKDLDPEIYRALPTE